MQKTLTLLLTLISIQSVFAQRFDWATTGGAAGIANSFGGALDIARDPQGNIYTVDFGNHAQQCQGDTLQKIASTTAYIYKFNSQGVLLFMNRVGALGGIFTPFNIETDDAGSLYLLGQPSGSGFMVVNQDTVPSVNFTNQLIKMDSDGNFIWKHNTGVSTNGSGCMLQYSNGYLYYQSGNVSVGKIDTAGLAGAGLTASYYNSPTASTGLLFKGSGVYPNGDLLFAAYSRGTVAYGADTLFHIGNPFLTAPFLFLRCDTSMNLIWARYASNGRDPDNNFIPVAIDNSNNAYAAVQVNQEMIFANDTIVNTLGGFVGAGTVIKFDSAGNEVWARAVTSTQNSIAWCMINAPDNSGIVTGGGYAGTAQFGSFILPTGTNLPFIAKFDFNGNYTNAFNYLQNPSQSDAKCISADGNGNYYVGGKLANNSAPVFSCTPAPGNVGFYIGRFTEQPDSVPAPTITVNGSQLTASPIFSGDIQWYLNGNIINGANGQTYTATQTGNYSVVYAYTSGCVGTDTSLVQTVTLSSINSNSEIDLISIYPNPSNGKFQIIGIDAHKSPINVYVRNVLGATVFISTNFKTNEVIDISHLSLGIYFVEIMQGHSVKTVKVLNQH